MKTTAKILLTLGLLVLSMVLMGFQDEDPDDGPREDNPVCTYEKDHPVATRIADRYDAEYEQVVDWFCSGYGLGEIMLAFETSQILEADEDANNDKSVDSLLVEKSEGNGWGNVWKNAGLIGRSEDGLPPGQARRAGNEFTPPGQAHNSGADDAPGNSGNAPGQNKDQGNSGQGNQGNPPGQSGDRGNSSNAPGHNDETELESTDDD